jgi:hypothetical protein
MQGSMGGWLSLTAFSSPARLFTVSLIFCFPVYHDGKLYLLQKPAIPLAFSLVSGLRS